jgi:glycine reductase
LEAVGIPSSHICTVTPISKTVGAVRIVPAFAIPFPVGNPMDTSEKESEIRNRIVDEALDMLTVDVE